jgi:hypothetical protein
VPSAGLKMAKMVTPESKMATRVLSTGLKMVKMANLKGIWGQL